VHDDGACVLACRFRLDGDDELIVFLA